MAPPRTRTRPQLSEVRDHEVIDLTNDDNEPAPSTDAPLGNASRGPRFGHDIIDITGDSSPEVQFLSSRRLPAPHTLRSAAHFEMELEVTGSAPAHRRNVNLMRHPMDLMRRTGGNEDIDSRYLEEFTLRMARRAALGAGNDVTVGDFVFPDLDFRAVAFQLELTRDLPVSPIYQAPPAAPKGFTRSAKEADVLVCPNCGDELCAGEVELKKQVWIVKGCGHVRNSVFPLVASITNTNVGVLRRVHQESIHFQSQKGQISPKDQNIQLVRGRGLCHQDFKQDCHDSTVPLIPILDNMDASYINNTMLMIGLFWGVA
jgi:hypothetical protein